MAKNLLKYCTSKSLYELDGEKQKKSGMAYIHLIPDFYDFQVRDVRNLELVRPLHLTCKFRCVAMERLVWWPQDLGLKILSSRTEREREKSQLTSLLRGTRRIHVLAILAGLLLFFISLSVHHI